ncbi:MAG: CBS domain-containing protein [Thermodesulfobacteriota bacterium]
MLKDETIRFLKRVPPFGQLPEQELGSLAEASRLEYYPRGARILSQDGPASQHLGLIRKGAVKVFMTDEAGQEIVIDYRNEAEHFGLLSLVSGDRSRTNVVAIEDTICYLLDRGTVLDLLKRHPFISEFFLKSFFVSFIDKTAQETRKHRQATGNGDQVLLATPVGRIIRKEPVTCPPDASIQEAARIMAQHRISSIVIADGEGRPQGIVTDRDLRDRVVAGGLATDLPVSRIMTAPLFTGHADEPCFEILLKMMHHRIHHILILAKDRLQGVVTNHDLMVLQGASPAVLVKEMERLDSVPGLATILPRLHKSAATLLREGTESRKVAGLVSELSERLLNRIVDLVEGELGPPPLPYTLCLFGEGARRELCLDLDVQLGIIVDDGGRPGALRAVAPYFHGLVASLNQSLHGCGIEAGQDRLPGRRVADLAGWKELAQRWIVAPDRFPLEPDLYDLRPIRGKAELAGSLRRFLVEQLLANPGLFRRLTELLAASPPPKGFVKDELVLADLRHEARLDLRSRVLAPLTGGVRLLALSQRLDVLATGRRLAALEMSGSCPQAAELGQAWGLALGLLLRHQLGQIEAGQPPDPVLVPSALDTLERKTLKHTFQLVAALHEAVLAPWRDGPPGRRR